MRTESVSIDVFQRVRAGRMLRGALFFPLLWLVGCRLWEAPTFTRLQFNHGRPSTRVLMIGNSLTYYNDLPGLLQQLSANEPAPIDIESITAAYMSLGYHWNAGAPDRIKSGHWNFVVLQEFSDLPATDRNTTLHHYQDFSKVVHESGAQVIVFENWTHRFERKNAAAMTETYAEAARISDGRLASIGAALRKCEDERPDINLMLDDRHPSIAGTYLAACVLYRTIYGKPASATPAHINKLKLSDNVAEALRKIADSFDPPATTQPAAPASASHPAIFELPSPGIPSTQKSE